MRILLPRSLNLLILRQITHAISGRKFFNIIPFFAPDLTNDPALIEAPVKLMFKQHWIFICELLADISLQ
jgi:hypothetical protein